MVGKSSPALKKERSMTVEVELTYLFFSVVPVSLFVWLVAHFS
jgi:hypothetical protein